jgi:UDP-N-acetylglucosamine--dolichyl-phosphate N-acetylglucosaminephosphotransferase
MRYLSFQRGYFKVEAFIDSMEFSYILVIAFSSAFLATFLVAGWIIPALKRLGLVGQDCHKLDKPEVAEMGGLAVIFGFCLAVSIAEILFLASEKSFDSSAVSAAVSVFVIAGLIGVLDDLFKLSHKVKPVLLLLAAAPIILYGLVDPVIPLPFTVLDLTAYQALYFFVIIPVAVTGAANVSNMLAGFNGLSTGIAIITSAAMALASWIHGSREMAFLFITMTGAQLAFLYYNRYPSKVFPGDTGTLSFGAFYAAGIVIGGVIFAGFIAFMPLIINASMSLLSVGGFFEEKQFRKEKMSAFRIGKDGRISFTRLEKPLTLCKMLLYKKPQSEQTLVLKVFILSILSSALGLAWAATR